MKDGEESFHDFEPKDLILKYYVKQVVALIFKMNCNTSIKASLFKKNQKMNEDDKQLHAFFSNIIKLKRQTRMIDDQKVLVKHASSLLLK